MEAEEHGDDVRAIERLIARQFGSLTWTPETSANWDAFAADFFPEASLYPAARPAQRQTVEAFVERMKGLAGTKLRSFHETVLGTEVRGVEMLLLLKNEGVWRIVSQAWDTESPSKPIPGDLVGKVAGV